MYPAVQKSYGRRGVNLSQFFLASWVCTCYDANLKIATRSTELEVFVDKTVRELPREDVEGKHARRPNKKV